MGDFRRLDVWKKAHGLTLGIYHETSRWPSTEQFGLISQTRRAAYSIPSNIAEGCGRDTDPEFVRFSRYALGSASELSYFLLLARDLSYFAPSRPDRLSGSVGEVRRMLSAIMRTTEARR